LNTGLPDSNVSCLYTFGENVFAGIYGRGLYVSPDNGNNWYACNSGLMNYNIRTVAVRNTDIYAGTLGGGIWKRALSELPLSISKVKIKEGKDIISVYPNPANGILTIEAEGYAKGNILSIIDMKGRELVHKELSGSKTQIDIGNLSNGVYFLKFKNDKFIEVKKVIKE
jgi:hypothetical protein